jgi:uncharacterized protein (TIGR00369 family)
MTNVPDGFGLTKVGGPFIDVNGPLWLRQTETGMQLGFLVEDRHVNGMQTCHGGMIATFCDMLHPLTARHLNSQLSTYFLPTISITVDYMASPAVGAWMQGEAQVLKTTGQLVFMAGLVHADGVLVARTNALLKIGTTRNGTAN